jgi:hypothetical protein
MQIHKLGEGTSGAHLSQSPISARLGSVALRAMIRTLRLNKECAWLDNVNEIIPILVNRKY